MNDLVKAMMQDTRGNSVIMGMLNDFCDGNITPKKGVMFGVKLRGIHDDYVQPLKDALAKAEADKVVLVEALGKTMSVLDIINDRMPGGTYYKKYEPLANDALMKARAALARVKEEA